MPRDGSNVYHRPPGTDAVTDTTIESSKYNAFVADVEQDLNTPRPIVAGGTGATDAATAITNLGGERAAQVVTNYDSQVFVAGSFYSAASATNPPVAGHAFAGICYVSDAANMVIEARDLDGTVQPGRNWVRQKKAGVWSAWAGDASLYISDTPPVGSSDNSLWWESDTGLLFVRYNDGDSSQWVIAMPMPDVAGFVAKGGDTMTGPLVLPGNPTTALQATTKQYTDAAVAAVAAAASNELTSKAVRYDIAQTLTAAQRAQARANIDVLKKNYVINGGMMVSQENGATAGPTNNYYPVDQFRTVVSGTSGVVSVAQVASATPGGSPNRIRCTVTTADAAVASTDLVSLLTKIEGIRVADLRCGSASAKTITLQLGVRAPAGTYCVTLTNDAATRSYVSEIVVAPGEANTDVVKAITVALDTTGTWLSDASGSGLTVIWGLMVGSSFAKAAGAWGADGSGVYGSSNQFNFMATNGNVFELFDVGLYEGAVAPNFQLPDYPSELLACQRLCWSFKGGVVGMCNGTTIIQVAVRHPVEMRTTPTLVQGIAFATANTAAASNINPSSINIGTVNLNSAATEFRINNYSGLSNGQAAIIQPQPSVIAFFNARL